MCLNLGEGMLMRPWVGVRGVVCRQEVLCLYLRHVIKCALIVKIFTGRKVKMPKAGENLRHIIKSSVEKVFENYSSTHRHTHKHTHIHRQVHPESTAALSASPCAEIFARKSISI